MLKIPIFISICFNGIRGSDSSLLRDRYEQVTPGYHMNKKHWNSVEIDSGIPDAELRKMIDHSYDLVAKILAKSTAKVGARSHRSVAAARRARR